MFNPVIILFTVRTLELMTAASAVVVMVAVVGAAKDTTDHVSFTPL